MKALMLILSLILLCIAYLLPIHFKPWPLFYSEVLTFASAFALLSVFLKQPFHIPKAQIWGLIIVPIPMIQWACGQVLDFGNALLCSAYLLAFILMIIVGYNLSKTEQSREKIFSIFSAAMLVTATISSVMAVIQWLDLAPIQNIVMRFVGNRPYANFGQPNNLATFLVIGLFGALYLYEKQKASLVLLIPSSLLIIFSIALTQSRTAWVVCLFTILYWGIKQSKQNKRLTLPKMFFWVACFIVCISILPNLTAYIAQLSQQDLVQTASVVERASSGYLRLDMWQQTLYAIANQPWLGYGWNQTSLAQMTVYEFYPNHEWIKSAHNVILDLLVWNGVILGGTIILYFTLWIYWLNRGVKETTSIVATLMVCAILIHAMLEYPIHYAYFLLPMGFLLGIIQGQYKNLESFTLAPWLVRGSWLGGIIILAVICWDYDLYRVQIAEANRLSDQKRQDQESSLDQPILLLTQFKHRVQWVALNPLSHVSDEELARIKPMVQNNASLYDLTRYAQLLAYNGKIKEAEQQLWIIQNLYKKSLTIESLLNPDGKKSLKL